MKRSKHSLSHYKLLSCDMGELVPVACLEVLPGDTVQCATSALIRMAPMLAPPMHPVHARFHWWYVPNRLIWDDFEKFITGGPDGTDTSTWPFIENLASNAQGTLADYLGVPVDAGFTVPPDISALPFRAYAMIWNEWYRDQDLQTPLVIDTTSGADTTTNTTLQNVNWEKDYFTSSRPWEQKGPAVTIPLTGDAPIKGISISNSTSYNGVAGAFNTTQGAATGNDWTGDNPTFRIQGVHVGSTPQIFADLASVSGVTINDLREALAIQRFEEARARYGSRFVEYLRYLGVRSSDARLQRPEYLGGGKQTLQFSEVLQTAPDATTGFVGTTRGHGIGAMRSRRFRRFFEEHGLIICLMSTKPRTMYINGLKRMWSRALKEDYWQKELEHIGQQEVLNKEIYLDHATPDGVFGYQDRFDEYRREESSVAGEFRTSTLNYWHLARDFSSAPALNAAFVSSVPTERVFASAATDVLYVMAMHDIKARRLVSKVGTSFTF